MKHRSSLPVPLTPLAVCIATGSLLAGCTVGPDYKTPTLAADASYESPEPSGPMVNQASISATSAPSFQYGQKIPSDWWQLFQNPTLNQLIQRSMQANPTITAAQASLRQAQELALAAGAERLPSASVSVSDEVGNSQASGSYKMASGALTVGYNFDLWGGDKRAQQAALAQQEYQNFQLKAAYLTLTGNLVTAVINEAALREQITATQDIVDALEELLEVIQMKVDVGVANASDLLQQQAVLKQTQASLPALVKSLEQQRNAIAALAGGFPNQYTDEFKLDDLTLPRSLPVSLPAALVQQRPDVRAAAAQAKQASANIGVATAARLPQISLSASIGSNTTSFSDLFSPGTLVSSVVGSLGQSVFDGGKLKHQQKAAEAAFDAASANYQTVVLAAFQDVADVLRALERDEQSLQAYSDAEQSARSNLQLAQDRFKVGVGAYTDVLSAQQTYQSTRISRLQANAQRYQDVANLFVALGGGWWNQTEDQP